MTISRTGRASRSKFRNVKTAGFASKREAAEYAKLKALEQAGKIQALRTQVRFPLIVNGVVVGTYVADFSWRRVVDYERHPERADVIFHSPDGVTTAMGGVVADAKGYKTDVYKLKKKLMKAIYGIDILEL